MEEKTGGSYEKDLFGFLLALIGSEITEAEFDAVPDTVFADMEKHTVHIGWALWSDLGDLDNDHTLVDQLAASYDGFTIE